MKINTLIFILFCISNAMAEQKMHKVDLEKELIRDEWIGPEKFVSELTAINEKVCEYILANNSKYLDKPFVIRRVLLITEKTRCSEKSALISEHLNSPDVLTRAAAIRLAATLSEKEKEGFKKKIAEIRKNENDLAIQEAAAKFFRE